MTGFNGGLIGVDRAPSAYKAAGIWSLNEQNLLRTAGRWPGVNPIIDLSPLLWYDFSDQTTVATSGAEITQVTNKGSASFTLSRSGTGPGYSTTINGLKCADWGSASNSIALRNTSSTSLSIAEIYIVQDSSETGSFSGYSALMTNTSESTLIYLNGSGTGFEGPFNVNRVYMNGGTSNVFSNVFPAIASPSILRATKNDGDVITSTAGLQLGMDRANNGRGWKGQICEVVIFSSVLSAANRNLVQGWLAGKWGIAIA